MGQQQLLLIILGVIIVGIAVAVGITMFRDNALSANKDAVINDVAQLAAKAQEFYHKPASLGGGGNSYVGLDSIGVLVSSEYSNNDNGRYFLIPFSPTQIGIAGFCKTQNDDGTYPLIGLAVTPTGTTLGPWINTATEIPTTLGSGGSLSLN